MRPLCILLVTLIALLSWSQAPIASAEVVGEHDLVQLIVDFPPGTWTPAHTHGGPLLVTVLAGETPVRSTTFGEQKRTTGQSFVEGPGEYLIVGNASNTTARNAAVVLLPKGAALTTTQSGINTQALPPGP